MQKENILELKKISKSFSGVQVLHDVDLTVKKGEVHVLGGENGAGKSTLVKIISGVYEKDGGEILFEGNPIDQMDIHKAHELGISIIHQEFNLLPYRTIGQNLYLGREPIKNHFFKTIDIK